MQVRHQMAQLQTMKQTLTPQMITTLHLLQLPSLQLIPFIAQKMAENPFLEGEPPRIEMPLPPSARKSGSGTWDEENIPFWERLPDRPPSPIADLQEQVRLLRLPKKEERILLLLIDQLDEQGYLPLSDHEIAAMFHLQREEVEMAVHRLQNLDPPGIGAKNLAHFLLIQLRHLHVADEKIFIMISDHLEDLANRRFEKIAQSLQVTPDTVRSWAAFIKEHLRPRPLERDETTPPPYIYPDLHLSRYGDEWILQVNERHLPRLRLSDEYEALLRRRELPKAARETLVKQAQEAQQIIRALLHRKKTLYRVMESILSYQRDFFSGGNLKPLTLKKIAEEIGLHESTVSRATAGKYVETPQGTFELKSFFPSGFTNEEGLSLTSDAVKRRIAAIIAREQKENPLSDRNIAESLQSEGVKISRRTVAKYREEMGIPTAAERKNEGAKDPGTPQRKV